MPEAVLTDTVLTQAVELVPSRRFPLRACPVCGCRKSKLLFRQSFDQLSGARLLDGYNVVICAECGAGFADDIPPQAIFDAYYRDLSKYDNADRGNERKPGSSQRSLEIASSIMPFLAGPDTRILEIGCGSGELLKVLQDHGFSDVLGADPSPGCVRTAQSLYGVPGITATILTVPEPQQPYDALILIGVMEHIQELDPAVDRLGQLLRDGGRIFLEVPDASRYVPRVDAPFQEFSLEHINFFSIHSLTNLMQQRGFRAVAGGHAVRSQNEVTCPTTFVVFEKSDGIALPLERDTETEAGLRAYIQGCEAEDVRIRGVIEQAVPAGEQMIVWGVGTHTLRLLATHGLDPARVALFVDSSAKYQGQELRGVPVVSPEALQQRPEPILISSRGFQSEIHQQIRDALHLSNPVILLYDGACL
jgi:SAM-dependent methyltransferase